MVKRDNIISSGPSVHCSRRLFNSRYEDWSAKISSFVPKLPISDDTCQLYANFMVMIAVLGAIPISIQAFKVYRTKETRGISIYAFMFQILISSLWVLYAFMCRNGIIIISSSLLIIASGVLIWLTIRNSPENEESS